VYYEIAKDMKVSRGGDGSPACRSLLHDRQTRCTRAHHLQNWPPDPEEFEKMKIQSVVGAEILSACVSGTRLFPLSALTMKSGTAPAILRLSG
jgi:hypothetical protein